MSLRRTITTCIDLLRRASRVPAFYYQNYQSRGIEGLQYAAAATWSDVRSAFGNPGEPIWERDWDVLLILDACRVDLMAEVLDEYEFLPDADELDTMYSVASMSEDWIDRTFAPEYRAECTETAYISGNPFTEKVEFRAMPALLDEVWKSDWNEDLKTIEARPITERAIHAWRTDRPNRMIVHYMQPHAPFVGRPDLGTFNEPADFGEGFADIWPHVGESLDYDEVWTAYRDNLRYVLDDVAVLLDNLDAETVAISADHGNAIGEWGVYGHPSYMLVPSIRYVPWVETSATDDETMDGRGPPSSMETTDETVAERLDALGYT